MKANAKRRLSNAAYAEKKRINADKDAALEERLQKIQKLEAQLAESTAKAAHLEKTADMLDELQAKEIIRLEVDGSVSVLSQQANEDDQSQRD